MTRRPNCPSILSAAWLLSGLVLSLTGGALFGCAPGDTDDEGALGEAAQEQVVCADGETVPGIDVSYWQMNIDWPAVKGDGVEFAIARAANGLNKDTFFDQNWEGMKSVGLIRGAYQYFRPNQDPIAQADLILAAIGPAEATDLPPVIDVETTDGKSPAEVADAVTAWVSHVEAAIGRKPIIYSGKYFWQDNVQSDAFGEYPLWIPNYSLDCPDLPSAYWDNWVFFQYTDSGGVAGVPGNVDRNWYNGSLDSLKAFAAQGGPDYAAEFVSQSFPYAADGALQMFGGQPQEISITLKNVGKAGWDENTRLATTEPRDRVSPFAGAEWPGSNRYAQVQGTVAPGETYTFKFRMHPPQKSGIYDEHFGMVQEGVAWFSDPGQGGPPDDQLEGLFAVSSLPSPTGLGSDRPTPPFGVKPHLQEPETVNNCLCSVPGGDKPASWSGGLLVIAALGLLKRRRPSRSPG